MSFSCRKRKKQRPNQLTLWDTKQILRCSPQTPKYLGSYILRFGSSRIYIHTSCTHTSITHTFVYNMLSTCVDVYSLPSYSIINSVYKKGRKSASMFGGNCFIQGFKWGLLLSKWERLHSCSFHPEQSPPAVSDLNTFFFLKKIFSGSCKRLEHWMVCWFNESACFCHRLPLVLETMSWFVDREALWFGESIPLEPRVSGTWHPGTRLGQILHRPLGRRAQRQSSSSTSPPDPQVCT